MSEIWTFDGEDHDRPLWVRRWQNKLLNYWFRTKNLTFLSAHKEREIEKNP